MKENSDGNDTNVGSIGNSIEEDITKINTYVELVLKKDYCNCNELNTILGKHCDGSKNVAYAMQHILSDYKRVLKENNRLEEQVEYDKTHIYTPQTIELNFISKSKIEDKIEHYQKLQHNYIEKYDEINEGLQAMISALKELLGKE
nr:MAG TPA: hypothetical protein [Caudoviricetes sp.]